MSLGVFVVDQSQSTQATCKTILGFRNILTTDIATGSGVVNADPDFPIESALDYSYNTDYSPNLASLPTTAVLVFTPSIVAKTNYFSLVSKNAQASGLSVLVEVFNSTTALYETVANFGSMTDGKPVMVYYGEDEVGNYINTISVRITLTYTAKPYIMSMMCGQAIVFPRTFSIGFQPADLAYLDEVREFNANEGLNLVIGRRLARGNQLDGKINFVRMDVVREFWKEYANHVLDSKPICILWNTNRPTEAFYGTQNPRTLTKPKYKNNLNTEIEFDAVGFA